MATDPSKQAKTILGWLPQHAPAPVAGGPGAAPLPPAPQAPFAASHPSPNVAPPAEPPSLIRPAAGAPADVAAQVAAAHAPTQYGVMMPAGGVVEAAQQTHAAAPPYGSYPAGGMQPYAASPGNAPAHGSGAPVGHGVPHAAQAYGAYPGPAVPQPYAGYPPNPAPSNAPAYGGYPGNVPQPYGGYPQHTAPAYGGDPHGGATPADAPARGLSDQPRAVNGSLRAEANATAGVSDRLRFIRLTYLHLLGAILVFAGLEYLLMTNSMLVQKVSIPLVTFALGARWNWGVVLAAFMAVSWIADYWASHTTLRPLQYAGLAFYVLAEALIFVPLLAIVQWKTAEIIAKGGGNPNIIRDAAFTTLGIFGALTASVFLTKKDFSFMRSALAMMSAAAMMLIILSLVFGFNLGIVFSIAMVLLAAGYILFQTSQVLAHYDPRNHVAAALALFSSIALMFWYVIRIFMRARE